MTSLSSENIRGLYVPLVTPFDGSGALDLGSLSRLSEHLVGQRGVTGLVTCARIGEGPVLSLDEQIMVTERVKSAVGVKTPVIGSILPATANGAAEQIDQLAKAGADAVMVFPPLLLGWGHVPDSVKVEFFRDLDRLTALPLVLFQTPMPDYRLSVDAIREIAGFENVVALKEASFDMNAFEATMAALEFDNAKIAVLNGNDRFVSLGSTLGAVGALIGIANLVPSSWAELIDQVARGEITLALKKEKALRSLQDVVFCEPILDAVARIKVILKADGVIASDFVRRPQCGISETEAREVLGAYRQFTDGTVTTHEEIRGQVTRP